MSDFIPLSKSKHAGSGWINLQNYNFAVQENMVPLVIDEIAHAIANLPLAFRRRKDHSGTVNYELVALLSPVANRNLFVKPDGSWLSGYIPAQFGAHPFRMMRAADSGQPIVCIDQTSGLLVNAETPNSQPFFAENGEPSQQFANVMIQLQRLEQRRSQTQTAVDALAECNLISPWRITIKNEAGKQEVLPGVFKINAAALQTLAAESLYKLHQCNSLPIAYAQLLSEPRIQQFGELSRVQLELNKQDAESVTMGNIEALFGKNSDLPDFDNL